MKKLNYLLLGAAGLMLASCSQDEIVAPGSGGDGNFNITVKLPADMATRSLGDALTANNLHIAVYDADNDDNFIFETTASFGGAIQTTVALNLAQGKEYNIAFFAVSPAADGTLYQFLPEGDTDYENPYIKVDYEQYGSTPNLADAYDCFYKLENFTVSSSATSTEVELTRPVAQINWGTNDLSQAVVDDAAYGANGQNLYSTLTIENAPYQLDLFEGVTNNVDNVEITALASPASTTASAAWTFPVNPETYKYIAMQYVLAPADQSIYNVSLDAYNGPDQGTATVDNEVIEVNNCPVQANYRTNIYGSLLTNPNEFVVIKNKDWSGEYDPSLELALQRGGTFTLESDVTLNERQTITNNLTINLNGFTITGPGSGTSADDGMFMVDGATLTIQGEGTLETSGDYASILIWAMNNATVNIYSGTYKANAGGEIIYIGGDTPGSTVGGTVNIYGGTFIPTKESNGKYSLLNIYDPARNNSKFNVEGGTFYNWNPANNTAEGAETNFVAEGYEAVETTEGENTIYEVLPAGSKIANSNESLKEAVSSIGEGGTIFVKEGNYSSFPNCSNLPQDVTIECAEGTVFEGSASPNLNGGSLIGATFSSNGTTITGTVNGKFYNCEFLGGFDNARWLYAGKTAYFEGCTFSGSTYGCHFDGGSNPLTFKDCTFKGFNAFGAAITLLTFDNCTFETNGKSAYNGINCWGDTVMNDCNFYFDGSVTYEWIDAKKSLIMNNCFINDVPASDPSVEEYFDNYSNITFN